MDKILTEAGVEHDIGDALWLNNSSIPSYAHRLLMDALKNERIHYKGIVKSGVGELMSV